MKKILILLLTLGLLSCLAACKASAPISLQQTPTAHNHAYTKKVIAPTCTEKGYTTYSCICGDVYTGNEVAAKGHSYSNATCTEAKKCTRCGNTTGSALGHEWVDATCQTPKTCIRCGTTDGSHAAHNMNDQGICDTCGNDVFLQFVKENISVNLIVPSVGASDNYYCEVKFTNQTGYDITLSSLVYANGKVCYNDSAHDFILETGYNVKASFYRSVFWAERWDDKYKDMYLDNNSTATTTIKVNGRQVAIKFGTNGVIDVKNNLNDLD